MVLAWGPAQPEMGRQMGGAPGYPRAHSCGPENTVGQVWQRGSRVANQLPLKRGDYFGLPGWPHVVTGVLKRRGKQKRELAGEGSWPEVADFEDGGRGHGLRNTGSL